MPADLSAILGKLSSVPKYHPFEADTFADWALEAGDIVTVRRGDTSYQSPVHSTTFKWNGSNQMTLHSTGARERESIAKISQKKYARSGSGIRNTQGLFNEIFSEDGKLYASFKFTSSIICARMTDYYNGLTSYIELTASRLYLEFKGWYDGLTSNLEFTRSRLRVEFYGLYDGLSSNLELTRSRLRVEFYGLYDGLESNLEFTRSRLRVEFKGLYDGLESNLDFTRSRLRVEFYGLYDGLESNLELTRSRLRVEFYGLYDGLESNLELTRSRLRVEFYGLYDGLESNLELTRSRLYVTFKGLYDGLESHLELTRSRLYITFSSMYDGLSSNLELTRSRLRIEFFGLYDGLGSNLELTRSRLRIEFYGLYDGLESNLEFTRSRLRVEFFGLYDGLGSNLELTRSRLRIEFYGLYDGLESNLEFTRSRLRVEFKGLYDGLESNLEYTRSRLRVEFKGLYDGLESNLELTRSRLVLNFKGLYDGLESNLEITRSSLSFTVNNNYDFLKSQISVHSSKIALVVSGTGPNAKIKAAEIVAAVNAQTGQSTVRLSADKIALSGDTTLSGALTIDGQGQLQVKKVLVVGESVGNQTIISNSIIKATTHQVNSSGSILFVGTEANESYTLNVSALKDMVKTITHAGNVLTVTKWNGDVINFNKATTLTASWGGQGTTNTFTVIGKQAGTEGLVETNRLTTTLDGIYIAGDGVASSTTGANDWTLSVPIKVIGDYDANANPSENWYDAGTVILTGNYDINAKVAYDKGVNAGKTSVTLLDPTWSSWTQSGLPATRTVTVKTTGRAHGSVTEDQKDITLTLEQGSWSNDTIPVNLKYGSSNYARTTVDASGIRTAGQNDVVINQSPWSGGVRTFTKSVGTGNSREVRLGVTWSQDGATGTYTIKDYAGGSQSGVDTGYSNSITVSDNGNNAVVVKQGSTTIAALTHNKYNAGKTSVTLLDPTWSSWTQSGLPETRTVTVKTSGRANGSTTEDQKDITLTLEQGSWSNNTIPVNLKYGSTNYARTTIDASGVYTAGSNAGKTSVTLLDPTWSKWTQSGLPATRTVTVKTTGRANGSTTEDKKDITLTLEQGSWSNNTIPVNLKYGSTNYARTTVDASGIYSNGQTAAGISYDTTYNKVVRSLSSSVKEYYLTVKTGTGEATSGTLDVAVNSFDSSHKAFANVRLGSIATGSGSGVSNAGVVTTPYSIQIDATSEYNTGKNDGKTSVTLLDPTWSSWTQSGLPATRTVTVRTSGRAHGSVQEAEQPITLTLEQGSTSGKTIYVNLKSGSSNYARLSADASGVYSDGWNAASLSVNVSGAFPVNMASSYPSTITVYKPGSVDGNPIPYQYQVVCDNDYAYIRYNSQGGNSNVARVANGAYSAGHTAGYNSGYAVGRNSVSAGTPYVDTGSSSSSARTIASQASNGDISSGLWICLDINYSAGWDANNNRDVYIRQDSWSGPIIATATVNANSINSSVSYIVATNSVNSDWISLGSDTSDYKYRVIRVNGKDYYIQVRS